MGGRHEERAGWTASFLVHGPFYLARNQENGKGQLVVGAIAGRRYGQGLTKGLSGAGLMLEQPDEVETIRRMTDISSRLLVRGEGGYRANHAEGDAAQENSIRTAV
jgi:hypothetical protein